MVQQGSELWYLLFPLFIVIIAVPGIVRPNRGKVLLAILLFFSMFRGDNVGNDTKNYMDDNRIYNTANFLNNFTSTEDVIDNFGYRTEFSTSFLNWIVYELNLPPRTIIFTYSILLLVLLYLALKRLQINTSLALMFFVLSSLYYFSLSAARQLAAVGLFAYGITFIFEEDKKRYLFFLFAILATSFHISSIFFIWLYFIRYIKIQRRLLYYIAATICIITSLLDFNITTLVYRFFDVEYVTRYMGLYDESIRSIKGRIFDFLIYVFFLLIFDLRNTEKESDTYDVLFILSVILMALFGHSAILIARITYFVTIFISFYISKVVIESELYNNRLAVSFFLLYCALCIYDLGTWSNALTSGYYLMF